MHCRLILFFCAGEKIKIHIQSHKKTFSKNIYLLKISKTAVDNFLPDPNLSLHLATLDSPPHVWLSWFLNYLVLVVPNNAIGDRMRVPS
jgi:hypothetical protein